MDSHDYPILEFDPERRALIEPHHFYPKLDVPEHCIFPFFTSVIDALLYKELLEEVTHTRSKAGYHMPLYKMVFQGKELCVMTTGFTAPMAVGALEFAIATGCTKFIAFGSAGVLNANIERNDLILPTSAIRDEGISYHYIKPSREIVLDHEVQQSIQEFFQEKDIPFHVGKTWTTDAFFRETRDIILKRRQEGAITVEMEASALCAVARFRKVKFGCVLIAIDDVSGKIHDRRLDRKSLKARNDLFWLAAEACLRL